MPPSNITLNYDKRVIKCGGPEAISPQKCCHPESDITGSGQQEVISPEVISPEVRSPEVEVMTPNMRLAWK